MREDTINGMLSSFLARDVEEPLTKEHLSSELAAFRLEFRTELHDGLDGLRGEVHGDMQRHFFWLMGTMLTMVVSMITVLITLLAKAG